MILVINYLSQKRFSNSWLFVIPHCLSFSLQDWAQATQVAQARCWVCDCPSNPRVFLWKHKLWGLSPTRREACSGATIPETPLCMLGALCTVLLLPTHLISPLKSQIVAQLRVVSVIIQTPNLTWDQQNQTTLSCVRKSESLFKSFSDPFIQQTSHAECCIFTYSFSKLQKSRKSGLSSVMLRSVAWKGGRKTEKPEATWSRTPPTLQAFAFRKTCCNPRKSCLENYSKQGSKYKHQMKQTQKSKNQQNREVKKKPLKCTQRVVFYTWWSFRFSLHVSLPSQTKVSEAAGPWKATVKRPWNVSIGQQEEEEPRTHGQRRYCKTFSQWLTALWPGNACTPQCLISPRPDSRQSHLLIKCQPI